jgi:hypothetical protein
VVFSRAALAAVILAATFLSSGAVDASSLVTVSVVVRSHCMLASTSRDVICSAADEPASARVQVRGISLIVDL